MEYKTTRDQELNQEKLNKLKIKIYNLENRNYNTKRKSDSQIVAECIKQIMEVVENDNQENNSQ